MTDNQHLYSMRSIALAFALVSWSALMLAAALSPMAA